MIARGVGAVAAMLAAAGAAAPPGRAPSGEQLFRRCQACHGLAPEDTSPAGPALHAIVGRRIAADPAFDYSPALRRFADRERLWSRALLDRFLAAPDRVVPGTEMGFLGITDPAERRRLIDWLATRPG